MDTNENRKETNCDDSDQNNAARTGILEKIFTVMSLVLIVGMSGYLIWQSFTADNPASFKIKTGAVEERGEFLGVEVHITNSGGESAKAVQVRGEVPWQPGRPMEAEATLDWLPANSTRKITLLFPKDADTSAAKVRVVGYEEP